MTVCHGDIGPWNVLQKDGRLTGVIDWDLARYGSPLDDVAELALEAVPLHGRHAETVGTDVGREQLGARLQTFCDAYGVPVEMVLSHIPDYLRMVVKDVRELAAAGTEPFASFEQGGISAGLEADLRHVVEVWR